MLGEAQETGTIGEKTYRRIRADIVFGRLVPGERLTLDRMRDIYSASVSTLREVLNRLCVGRADHRRRLARIRGHADLPGQPARSGGDALPARIARAARIVRSGRHGVGGQGRRRASQARVDGATDGGGTTRRGGDLEALRPGVSPRADLGLRLAGAARHPRDDLRPVFALPDDRGGVPRRRRRGRAPAAARMRIEARLENARRPRSRST